MKVDTMRRIDFFVGVPLCFLGTVLYKLGHLFYRPARKKAKNVLFIELSEMGSAILVDPAMRKLRRQSGANIYFAIFKKNKASLKLLNTVPEENIYTIRENSMPLFFYDMFRFIFWTRKTGIDAVVDLELFSRITALMTGFSGAAAKVGYHAFHNEGLYRGNFLTHKVSYNPHIHITANFIAMINALLSEKEEIPYSKTLIGPEELVLAKATVTEEEKDAIRRILRDCHAGFDPGRHKIVLINPNASELLIQRRWPPPHYVRLIQMILEYSSRALVLITGDPREREEAERLKEAIGHDRCVNFAGKVTFAQLPHLYSISEFMVTNDSGPGHFSAVTDMHSFVIFGPETPALYGSLGKTTPIFAGLACSPCVSASNHRKTACTDNVCLQVIKPEQVFDVITPNLERINAES